MGRGAQKDREPGRQRGCGARSAHVGGQLMGRATRHLWKELRVSEESRLFLENQHQTARCRPPFPLQCQHFCALALHTPPP